jgi:hypothetical protein
MTERYAFIYICETIRSLVKTVGLFLDDSTAERDFGCPLVQ